MAPNDFSESIQRAFPVHWMIIQGAIAGEPTNLSQLFEDLSQYVLSRKEHPNSESQTNTKKRKLDDEPEKNHVVPQDTSKALSPPILQCNDVSVQVPVRKKMKVELTGDDVLEGSLLLKSQTSPHIGTEHCLHASEVEAIFCLPTPDKQVRQANFVVMPKNVYHDKLAKMPAEQIVFVMNDTPVTGALSFIGDIAENDTCISVTHRALDLWLTNVGKRVITPSAAQFASSIPQSHRKGEKAYHVRAHRGSKEGENYFNNSRSSAELTIEFQATSSSSKTALSSASRSHLPSFHSPQSTR